MVQTSKPRSGTRTKAHNDARRDRAKAPSANKAERTGASAGSPRKATIKGLIGVWVVAIVGVVSIAALAVAVLGQGRGAHSVESYGEARIGGPFKMVDQTGRAVDERVLLGKWSAVFFGYTYCPDTCPATLAALGAAQARLGPAAKAFQVVFVSIDPARDTPAQMKLYLSAQGFPGLGAPGAALGLTGSPAQVADIAKAYAVFYAKAGQGQDYLMDHSAAIYLMDPQGKFVRPLVEAQGPAVMAKQIVAAMAQD
jgi:protein SCO1/2